LDGPPLPWLTIARALKRVMRKRIQDVTAGERHCVTQYRSAGPVGMAPVNGSLTLGSDLVLIHQISPSVIIARLLGKAR
jgi:hypothetical protein